jgi:hypothetical protein
MSSNNDPAVRVVIAEDAVVVVASNNNNGNMQAAVHSVAKSKRKHQKHQFPWEYVKDWQDDDSAKHCGKRQCTVCCKWYSRSTNASSWKAHMKSAHSITDNDTTSFAPSGNVMFQSTLSSKPVFLEPVLRKYKNVVVDYVVERGVTLRNWRHSFQEVRCLADEWIRAAVNSNDPTTNCRAIPHLGTIAVGISV